MRNLCRILAVIAALAALFMPARADAATLITTPAGGASCIWSMDGTSTAGSNLASGTVLRWKCYYDAANPPAGYVGWLTSSVSGWTGTGSNCVTIAYGGSGTVINANLAAGTNRWTTPGISTVKSGAGFVEGSLTLTKTQGTSTFAMNPTYFSIRTDPNCDGTYTDGRIMGVGQGGAAPVGAPASPTYAAASSWSSSMPVNRWGDEFSDFPFCGAVVTATKDGQSVTSSTPIKNGDRIVFSTAWTSGRTGVVKVRFPGYSTAEDQYVRDFYSPTIYTPGQIGNPHTFTVTAQLPGYDNQLFTAGRLVITCLDSLTLEQRTINFGSAVDTAVLDNGGRPRPCDLARFYWPSPRQVAVGDVLTWQVNYSGTPSAGAFSTIDIEAASFDSSAGVPSFSSLTWTNVANDLPLGYSGSFTRTAAYAGNIQQFVFRCVDHAGTVMANQWTTASRYTTSDLDTSPERSMGACFTESGYGLDPRTWLPAGGRMFGCIGSYLFMPTPGKWSGTMDGMSSSLDASVLGEALDAGGSVLTFVQDLSADYGATCSGSSVEIPLGPAAAPVNANFFDACFGPAATVRNVVWTLLSLIFTLAGIVAVYNTGVRLIGHGDELTAPTGKPSKP